MKGVRLTDLELGRKGEAQARAAKFLHSALTRIRPFELGAERIQPALAGLREAGKANQTVNHYRAALRAFLRWAGDKGRVRDNAMRGVRGYNVEEDSGHVRRSLTDNELTRLIVAARSGQERFGMSGSLRSVAYRLAAANGFRAAELRILTPESLHLGEDEPSVVLRAGSIKNRRSANQFIPLLRLTTWCPSSKENPPASPSCRSTMTPPKAIRSDLEAVGIPYETDEGVADFHSLRGYSVSSLVRSGATIKEVQTLARHAEKQTTLNHYAKVSVRDLQGAVESLPSRALPNHVTSAFTVPETQQKSPATAGATRSTADFYNMLPQKDITSELPGFANEAVACFVGNMRTAFRMAGEPCASESTLRFIRSLPPDPAALADPLWKAGFFHRIMHCASVGNDNTADSIRWRMLMYYLFFVSPGHPMNPAIA